MSEDWREESDHYERSPYRECEECGGRADSLEWDGLCYRCAHRPETPEESLSLAWTRASGEGECLVRYLLEPEAYLWTPADLYSIAVRMFHNAHMATSAEALLAAREVSARMRRRSKRADVIAYWDGRVAFLERHNEV